VASRVVKLILRLSGCGEGAGVTRFGRAIPLTHQEIADMVGTTRQTVTTVLTSLKRKGAVRTEHHCIHIQRQELLQDMVAGAQP
jgi:CRP/FNR family cyclic AMP-dependent transcriptional regulator